jgi:cyclophilin family peptidyl-prolyl cis-trans isomerase
MTGLQRCFVVGLTAFVMQGCSSAGEENVPPVMSALDAISKVEIEAPGGLEPATPADETATANANIQKTGTFKVKFETSKGDFIVEVHRDWAPIGADQFHKLVKSGFYDDCRVFRAIDGFMVQFGIAGDPAVHAKWRKNLVDDPVKKSNKRSYLTYAKTGAPNSRTTQIFISYGDNAFLDDMGFAPFAQVIKGMDVADSFYKGYGESASKQQGTIEAQGNAFLDREYPKLDTIKKVTLIEAGEGDK